MIPGLDKMVDQVVKLVEPFVRQQHEQQERAIKALERIADALEKRNG